MYIKGMNKDMTCRGFQFEVGKEYKIEHDGPLRQGKHLKDFAR